MEEYSVYSEFNVKAHKETFVHYLEVVIHPDGRVEYAVPSHQEKLIAIVCEKHHISREELMEACPSEFYGDFLTWLCMVTGCISVWEKYIVAPVTSVYQRWRLRVLKANGLYLGDIPEREDR